MLFWPALLVIFLALFRVYDAIFSCNSGFFIGGCMLGKWILSILIIESLLVYFLLATLIFVITKAWNKRLKPWYSIITGIVSVSMVGASVIFILPGFFDLFMFPVFWLMGLFSGSSPFAVFSAWATQIHLFFPFEPKTILERLGSIFFLPFLP